MWVVAAHGLDGSMAEGAESATPHMGSGHKFDLIFHIEHNTIIRVHHRSTNMGDHMVLVNVIAARYGHLHNTSAIQLVHYVHAITTDSPNNGSQNEHLRVQ